MEISRVQAELALFQAWAQLVIEKPELDMDLYVMIKLSYELEEPKEPDKLKHEASPK